VETVEAGLEAEAVVVVAVVLAVAK